MQHVEILKVLVEQLEELVIDDITKTRKINNFKAIKGFDLKLSEMKTYIDNLIDFGSCIEKETVNPPQEEIKEEEEKKQIKKDTRQEKINERENSLIGKKEMSKEDFYKKQKKDYEKFEIEFEKYDAHDRKNYTSKIPKVDDLIEIHGTCDSHIYQVVDQTEKRFRVRPLEKVLIFKKIVDYPYCQDYTAFYGFEKGNFKGKETKLIKKEEQSTMKNDKVIISELSYTN